MIIKLLIEENLKTGFFNVILNESVVKVITRNKVMIEINKIPVIVRKVIYFFTA